MSQANKDEGDDHKGTEDGGSAILTDQQTPEVAKPGEEPSSLVEQRGQGH
jgi:hypothetical protein